MTRRAAALALIVALVLALPLAGRSRADQGLAVAVMVHADRPTTGVSLAELRALFTLERQFWPDGSRVVLMLPASSSPAKAVLLEQVYGMSDAALRRYWTARLFQGAIPAIPTSLKTTSAAVSAVRQAPGALAAVPASEVPGDVRVLKIDGKLPGERGYPLVRSEQ